MVRGPGDGPSSLGSPHRAGSPWTRVTPEGCRALSAARDEVPGCTALLMTRAKGFLSHHHRLTPALTESSVLLCLCVERGMTCPEPGLRSETDASGEWVCIEIMLKYKDAPLRTPTPRGVLQPELEMPGLAPSGNRH